MSKFCGNCGAELDDSAKVCGQCGTPLDGAPADIPGVKTVDPEKQKKVKKFIILGAVAIALIVVVAVVVNIISNSTGYKGLVSKVMDAYEDYAIDDLVEMSSDVYYYNDYDEDAAEHYFERAVGEGLDRFEDRVGHNYRLSYETFETYYLSERKLDKLLTSLENNYPDFNVDIIEDVAVANLIVTAEQDGRSHTIDLSVTMTEEDGTWKVLYIDETDFGRYK